MIHHLSVRSEEVRDALEKTTEHKEFWDNIRRHFFKKYQDRRKKKLIKTQSASSLDGAEKFGEAVTNITSAFRHLPEFISKTLSSTLAPAKDASSLPYDFKAAIGTTFVSHETLNQLQQKSVVQDFEQALNIQMPKGHIGPLTEQFTAYTELRNAGIDYRPAEGGYVYSLTMLKEEFSERILQSNRYKNIILVFQDTAKPTTNYIKWDRTPVEPTAQGTPAYIYNG